MVAASDAQAPGDDEGEPPVRSRIAGALGSILQRRKPLHEIQAQAKLDYKHDGAKYGLFDLVCIGVGSTVGSGCFVLTGTVLPVAGPSAVLSWVIAAVACCLSAVAYIELSTRVPTSGACYIFCFHALGEPCAVLAALCLTLEYGVAAAGCARSWSELFTSLTGTEGMLYFRYPAGEGDAYADLPALLLMLASVCLCIHGVDVNRLVVNALTACKVGLVAFLIFAGLAACRRDLVESAEVFFPKGFSGTVRAASALFFGFIGFDEVCCVSSKAMEPERNVPRALVATLVASCGMSVLAQLALATMVPSDEATSWPEAFGHVGWAWAQLVSSVGEVILLPLIVLLSFLPQPELLAAMAQDGLLPSSFAQQDENGTFVWGIKTSGAVSVLMAVFVPFSVLWDLVSLGVLLSFNFTNSALIMLRYGNGGALQQPAVAKLLAVFWPCAAAAGYAGWRGLLQPWLDGEAWNAAALVLFLFGSIGSTVALCGIRVQGCDCQGCEHKDDAAPLTAFRTPFVPFLPGVAMWVNFMLMSTYSLWHHLWLAAFLACGFLGYAAHRAAKGDVVPEL